MNNPSIEYVLFPRLVEIIKKYNDHFGKKPNLFNDLLNSYERRLGSIEGLNKEEIKDISVKVGLEKIAYFIILLLMIIMLNLENNIFHIQIKET